MPEETGEHDEQHQPFSSWDMINELQPELDHLATTLNGPRPLPEDTPTIALAFLHAVQRMRDNRGLPWSVPEALVAIEVACTTTAMTGYAKAVRSTIRVYQEIAADTAGMQ
jgi:hypothetical protein